MQSKASSSSLPAPFQCSACKSTFTRLEHLQRHGTTHTSERPFDCGFCEAAFTRKDALLRHLKTCASRLEAGQPIPRLPQRKRGRKQHACDQCAQRKRGCNQSQPCSTCAADGKACCYSRSRRGPSGPSTVASLAPASAGPALPAKPLRVCAFDMASRVAGHSPVRLGQPRRLEFLTTFTSTTGMANSFGCGSDTERRYTILTLAGVTGGVEVFGGDVWDLGSEPYMGYDGHHPGLLDPPTHWPGAQEGGSISALHRLPWDFALDEWLGHPLAGKSQEIVRAALVHAKTARVTGAGSCTARLLPPLLSSSASVPSPSSAIPPLDGACYRFFSPRKLEMHLVAFWSLWYPNCPIFHKPMFDAAQRPAPLIAAMALIGACLTSEDSRNDALAWADAIEDWVFLENVPGDDGHHERRSDGRGNGPIPLETSGTARLSERLDDLRAKYCVVLFLSWEGNEEQKRRARRARFSSIVAVARSLATPAMTHGDLQRYVRTPSLVDGWAQFVAKEELIRTLTYVFLLDTAYVIFNNTPPRVGISELDFGLACPEVCFQAGDAISWHRSCAAWAETCVSLRQDTVASIIESLAAEHLAPVYRKMLRQMSVLNFFTVVSAFHTLLFNIRCMPASLNVHASSPMRRTLRHWEQAWLCKEPLGALDDPAPAQLADSWKRVGFARFCLEFWCLASLLLKLTEDARRNAHCRGLATLGISTKQRFLDRYDNSDMAQVHDLVLRFPGPRSVDSS